MKTCFSEGSACIVSVLHVPRAGGTLKEVNFQKKTIAAT